MFPRRLRHFRRCVLVLALTSVLSGWTSVTDAGLAAVRFGETIQADTPPRPPVGVLSLQRLPVDLAVNQMVAVSFYGTEISPGLRHLILDEKVGAVLLFRGNFVDATGLARLTARLDALGREAHLPAPLLVAIDQEGGRVMRVTDGVAPLPAAFTLAASGPDGVRAATVETAAGLRRLGIGLNLAPVADLRTSPNDAVIGDRSFGWDSARVGPLVAAGVEGLHGGGVGATLKHFPGLGGAPGDPHGAIPTDVESRDQWEATQAVSFAAGIAAGADAVMTTAMYVPGLDETWTPAIFSRSVVTGLLRERLGFQGVIVSDALNMGGIADRYSLPEAAVAAVGAGNDLLLLGYGDTAYEEQALAALRQAVVSGTLAAEQVQRSAARIIALRSRWPDPRLSPTGAIAWP